MRFRSSFGWAQGAALLFTALIFGYLWGFAGHHHSPFIGPDYNLYAITALCLALSAALWFSLSVFTYWNFESNALRERRLWKTKAIPWSEVTYVGPWESHTSKWINIEYERKPPLSEHGRIVATPARRKAFIAAFHRFAPQAEFEL